VVSEGPERLHLHLTDGSMHETDAKDPNQYHIQTFSETDIPIDFPQVSNKQEEEPAPLPSLVRGTCGGKLRRLIPPGRDGSTLNFIAALPFPWLVWCWLWSACRWAVLQERRQVHRFVLTILLVLAYYAVTLVGVSFARKAGYRPR